MSKLKVKPMLAYNASKKPITEIEYRQGIYVQPKLDGVRCLIQANVKRHLLTPDLNEIEVKAYSRTGKEFKNIDHILEQLVFYFKMYPNRVLDGELYNHELKDDFEKIISLVRKTKPTDEHRKEAAEKIKFYCYDFIPEQENEHYDFATRNAYIKNDFHTTPWAQQLEGLPHRSPSIEVLKYGLVYSKSHAEDLHKNNLSTGYEGTILRKNALYEQKRSYNLQKFKDFHDAEATIVGFVEGKGKRKGTLGKFLMIDSEGIRFGCPPGKGYNYKDLRALLHRAQWYVDHKATATFTFFERTKANSYRHPFFKCIRDYE